MILMSTKSFLKNINIKNRASASNFVDALENAAGKGKKKVKLDRAIETVKDSEKIRKLFSK